MHNNKIYKSNLYKNKVSLAVAAAVSSMMIGGVAQAAEKTAKKAESIEVIEVTGIRKSLEAAAGYKKLDNRIVDAIVAEDIGKLPDNNIAESLQRITGVSINRDMGVGSEVSIRGIKQNRVELNGRSTLGDGRNGVNFQDFPSDFLNGLEVVKSPTAKMIEGALGGTINLKTKRPLSLKDPIVVASAKAEYGENAEEWGSILSLTAGNKYDLGSAGTFGVMGSLSYLDRELMQHEFRIGIDVDKLDTTGDGVKNTKNYVLPKETAYLPAMESRERTAGNISFQWAPQSEDGNVYLEGAYTSRDGASQYFSPQTISPSHLGSDEEREDYKIDESTRELVRFTDTNLRFINRTEASFRKTDTYNIALGTEWTLTDTLGVAAEISTAKSDSEIPKLDFRFYAVDQAAEALNPDALNPILSGVTYQANKDALPSVFLTDKKIFTDEKNWVMRRFESAEDQITNKENALRADFTLDEPIPGLDIISSVEAGFRLTDRDYRFSKDRLYVTGLENGLTKDSNPIVIKMQDVPGVKLYEFDAFPDESATFEINTFRAFDGDILQDRDRTLKIVADLLKGTNKEITGNATTDMTFQEGNYATVSEQTTALYAQVNIETEIADMDFRAIVGGRYVQTDLEVGSYGVDVKGKYGLLNKKEDYNDFLPSLNATLEVSEDTLVRFASAKVMRRADFDKLNPAWKVNSDNTDATRGTPELAPYRATQYDLSVEHYFGEGDLVSVAIFYKDVESFFDKQTECVKATAFTDLTPAGLVERLCRLDPNDGTPVKNDTDKSLLGLPITYDTNGESGFVKGLELGYQQTFDSGFGYSANYTYADSEDPTGFELEDISEHTFNASAFYEKDAFSTRLAYTYRSRFLDESFTNRAREVGKLLLGNATQELRDADPTLGNGFRDPVMQLDWSASYDINKSVRLQADIVNITKEATYDSAYNGTIYQVRQADRRMTIGVRAKF